METTSADSTDCQQMVLDGGKHIMLSYNWNSQAIVSQIYQILKDKHIPTWFDINGDIKDNIYDRYGCEHDRLLNTLLFCLAWPME